MHGIEKNKIVWGLIDKYWKSNDISRNIKIKVLDQKHTFGS